MSMQNYRSKFEDHGQSEVIADWWDGSLCRDYHKARKGLFGDLRDLALSLSIDGVSMVTERTNPHMTTPVLLQVLNLPPSMRVKREHMLLYTLLPGPGEPGELRSWLRPLWRELKGMARGVLAVDGVQRAAIGTRLIDAEHPAFFNLRAYLTLIIGDQGASKGPPMHLGASRAMGPSSAAGCIGWKERLLARYTIRATRWLVSTPTICRGETTSLLRPDR